MRRRRIDRLIGRAESAITEGDRDQVAQALDEVRCLAPETDLIASLERALDAAPSHTLAVDASPTDAPISGRRRAVGLLAGRAVAGTVVAAAGLLIWIIYASPQEQLRTLFPSMDDLRVSAPPAPGSAKVESDGSGRVRPSAHVRVETVKAAAVGSLRPDSPAQPNNSPTVLSPPAPEAATATSGATTAPAQVSQPAASEAVAMPDGARSTPVPEPTATVAESHADAVPALPVGAAAKPERTASVSVPEDAAVRAVLNKYAAAYSHLDAAAAQAVWPAVNRPALSRAFDGLASQRVVLDRCNIDVGAATARATCAGSAIWSPKIGNGGPRTETRTWSFQLARAGADWQIVTARVQNR